MAKKHRSAPQAVMPGRNSTPADRITWLLDTVWGGNRSAMARDVGVTHSVLTKVASGQQGPGQRLMAAIAFHPKVNPGWLLSGDGEPLLADSKDGPAQGWGVPIANQLLPGPLDDHRGLLSSEFFPTAGAFYRSSRYWLRIAASEPVVKVRDLGVQCEDLLLMETDPLFWSTEEIVNDRLCAVRLAPSSGVELGLVAWTPEGFEEPPILSIDRFKRPVDPSALVERYIITKYPSNPKPIVTRHVLEEVTDKEGKKTVAHMSNLRFARMGDSILLRQIVAACVLLVRLP